MGDPSVDPGDRGEIGDLLVRYSLARDDRRVDALLACFTEDAVFVRSGRAVSGAPAIREFFRASMQRYSLTNHTAHGAALEATADPDELRGMVPGHAELVLDGRLIVAAYRYRDRYRRVDGHWLLARRELGFVYAVPAAHLATGFSDGLPVRWPGTEPAASDHPRSGRSEP